MANDSSNNNANGQASAAVALFQKAHQKMVLLQRVDEQLAGLIDQRKKIQDELKTLQGMINEEFDRVTRLAADVPVKLVATITDEAREMSANASSNGRTNNRVAQVEEEAAA
jgi:uncharacterized protein YfeS